VISKVLVANRGEIAIGHSGPPTNLVSAPSLSTPYETETRCTA